MAYVRGMLDTIAFKQGALGATDPAVRAAICFDEGFDRIGIITGFLDGYLQSHPELQRERVASVFWKMFENEPNTGASIFWQINEVEEQRRPFARPTADGCKRQPQTN